MDATSFQEKPGLTHEKIDGLPVGYSPGSEARARTAARRIANARRWLTATVGQAPPARLLILDAKAWPHHATFPVFGMPHFTDEVTLAIAAEPAPFLAGFVHRVVDRADADGRSRIAEVYGSPPDPMLFFDLLAVHELGHLHQFAAGMSFAHGWLSELHTNLILQGYVASEEPEQLGALTTLVDIGSHWPAHEMRYQRLEEMHDGVDLEPDNYGWFQMNLEALSSVLWDAHGVDVLRRFESSLCWGQPATAASLRSVSPLLADFRASWPQWRRQGK